MYELEREALYEISNATVHALIHVGWPSTIGTRPQVAIYIKSRGFRSRVYMAAIRPFRHLLVYPSWMAHIAREWAEAEVGAPTDSTTTPR